VRIGAIDLGTNSCRFLLVEYAGGTLQELKKGLRITRLGAGVDRNKLLSNQAIERALAAVLDFVGVMKSLQVDQVTLLGTSALREVSNAFLLAERIKEKTGLQLRVVSGAEEARLNYLGAGEEGEDSLILDIGGGSTELIWQAEGGIINYRSLDIGAVRMTERYIRDPEKEIREEDLLELEEAVRAIIREELESLPANIGRVIGLGGTITTLAAIEQQLEKYDSARIQDYLLEKGQVEEILKKLSRLSLAERRQVKGLEPGRADIIVAGIKILTTVMDIMAIKEIRASEKDLLYGAIKELAKKFGLF
jgi:exopolyphosphatase/guanosine-5'-triphosphate,3'-diphosphate pyrophosphatase